MQRTDITAEGMRELRAQGLGWRDIAAHYGVSYVTIRRHRDRAGVHPTEKGTAAA
jgi:transposase